MSIAWIWLSGLAFAVIHSWLATSRCKDTFYRRGVGHRAYRMAYSLLAIVLTALWFGFVPLLPDAPLYRMEDGAKWLMTGLQLGGIGIVIMSFRAIDVSAFLGLSDTAEGTDPFVETGIYRYMRHPMYTGVMIALFASPSQTVNSMNLFAVIALYFIIGARFEERRMLAVHPAYAGYMKRVPAFIPFRALFPPGCGPQ
ncbi:MAG: isoprenylcysteine carboxylmethyltransferase family protein [Mariprofundaceae bacterium]|nr:isoprenylcysteine carboxylmethyltransferase family protein [Mariprofundaceae bacterium]